VHAAPVHRARLRARRARVGRKDWERRGRARGVLACRAYGVAVHRAWHMAHAATGRWEYIAGRGSRVMWKGRGRPWISPLAGFIEICRGSRAVVDLERRATRAWVAAWTGRVRGGKGREQVQLRRPRHGSHDGRSIMHASRRSLHSTGSLSQRVLARLSFPCLPPSCLLASRLLVGRSTFITASTPFTHPLRVHHLHVFPLFPSGRRHLFPFPHSSRALLVSGVLPYMYTRATLPVNSVAVLPPRFPFSASVFPFTTYGISARVRMLLHQSMHLRYFLIPNRAGIHLVNKFCRPDDGWSSALRMAGESKPTKRSRVDAYSNIGRAVCSQRPLLNLYADSDSLWSE
jgi:hypothetical protein